MNTPAYRADGQLIEREAFYAIACDPQRSVVVEACAGAGKTWMLVSRILRALLEGAQPQEILAITFTRKAAGEMRERLHEWLRDFSAHAMDDDARAQQLRLRGLDAAQAQQLAPALGRLHETLLANGRSVEIRTFHAWFSQLLRAAPRDLLAELGLAPGMTLMEELDDHRAAVFRRFHGVVAADAALRADHAALVQRRGRDQLRKWLEAALDKRVELELADAAGVLDASMPPPDCDGHPCEALKSAAWRDNLRELARGLGQGGAKAQAAANGVIDAMSLPESQAMFQGLRKALFTEKGTPRKLGDLPLMATLSAELEALLAQVQQYEAHQEHLQLVRLSRVLLRELAGYKRTRGLADMADLERCALALLRDASLSGWVQERLDMRIRHVLIDEFQDTSPLQWHALHSWLSAYAGAGGGASGQRPPGVFIVGDPKQSIYRFRRAEPKVFGAAREFVTVGLHGHWLACDHTRRNAPQVLDAVNQVFEQAEREALYDGFRPHTTELQALPAAGVYALPPVLRVKPVKGAPAQPSLWRDSLAVPRHEPETQLREQEARHVAHAIHELLADGSTRPGEVFVLCRKRASLRLVARELQALHLPYAAAEDHALMDAAEVRDLVAVLDVLASPEHRLSLAHALRSPVFGVSDDELVQLSLAARDHAGDWWAALQQMQSPSLARAARLLASWHEAAAQLPPHDLLDRIVFEGEVRERVAAVVPPEQRLAALNAIDALLAQALTLDGARYATPYNFVRALKRRLLKAAAPVQPDAVQLLTVHGAKGLEAKVVFVMDSQPEAAKPDTATLLIDWPVEADRPRRCAFLYSEAQCPPSLRELMADEMKARQREELNGLYVAMTRARERLVFSRTEPHHAGASWWERVEGLAQAWQPAAPAQAAAGVASPIVLQVLPAGRPLARATPPVLRSPDTPATRLGQAVHRVLEWASAQRETPDLAELAEAAAAEFGAPPGEVARMASAIWQNPQCRRFLAGPGLLWAGNEVPMAEGGEVLRLDRLVKLDDGAGPTWWVLDYKLSLQPGEQAEYREQMLRYRRAVAALAAGEPVRCALVNGRGDVIEVT
ncbi:exodeoxyribonuclease V subunit beta [Piscinibacter sp. HJYY11]|uniref:UvrD-helicase domain-containing protein n=1 Tax=Piscinibacter sp. HJYY11 TaxID=2801333 RepID=UPI00191F0CB1|nr:UvrD-helicase domain-containing protein [Piscinibacter sp. HJYY11]MBL0731116.1 UvrD-helicase domain-containing protein [Piscinibacter sp. HJYY11]